MIANQKLDLGLDIITFIIHLAVALGISGLAMLMQAPLFGARPDATETFLARLFFLFAISIFVSALFLIGRRSFSIYLITVLISLVAAVAWCFLVSSYDMISFIISYLVLIIPILLAKYALGLNV